MTASTAPITLPARHRQAAPEWRFHILVAWLAYWAALAFWALRLVRDDLGRRHIAALAAAATLILGAIAALLLTR